MRNDQFAVDQYLEQCSPEHQQALQRLREQVKRIIPDAEEKISYGMPMFKWHGMLVSYASFKNHCSFFPCTNTFPDDLKSEIKPYMSGKSTLQFQPEQPLPAELIEKIVHYRMRVNEEKMMARKAGKKK